MYINVIYPDKISFRHIKNKSRKFFSGTNYWNRNSVFINNEKDSFFSLNKNVIHIYIPSDDNVSQVIVNDFLKVLFGSTLIGISGMNERNLAILNSINYVLI